MCRWIWLSSKYGRCNCCRHGVITTTQLPQRLLLETGSSDDQLFFLVQILSVIYQLWDLLGSGREEGEGTTPLQQQKGASCVSAIVHLSCCHLILALESLLDNFPSFQTSFIIFHHDRQHNVHCRNSWEKEGSVWQEMERRERQGEERVEGEQEGWDAGRTGWMRGRESRKGDRNY